MDEQDREARFRALYERHYPSLLGYARRRLATRADAEDVVADTFLVLWRRLYDAPPEEQLLPWLYGVIRRVMANRYRRQERERRLGERLEEISRVQPVTGDVGESEARRLFAAMRTLREEDREVLLLAAWDGLGTAELARVLSCSENAAAIRLHRARQRLAEAFVKGTAPRRHEPGEG